jgi:hypothetical protein
MFVLKFRVADPNPKESVTFCGSESEKNSDWDTDSDPDTIIYIIVEHDKY